MDGDSIVLRAANPSFDEGLAFARYLDAAAEGFFGLMFGRRTDQILATAFTEPDHDLSYQNVTFAERDHAIVGMVSAYTAERHRQSSLEPLKRAAGRRNLRVAIVSAIFAPMTRIIHSIDDGDFYIQAIAVDDDLRGRHIGSALADFAEDRGRACGSTRLSLDVSVGNTRARRFYAGRGMAVASRWPKWFALPGLTFYRMTKPL